MLPLFKIYFHTLKIPLLCIQSPLNDPIKDYFHNSSWISSDEYNGYNEFYVATIQTRSALLKEI